MSLESHTRPFQSPPTIHSFQRYAEVLATLAETDAEKLEETSLKKEADALMLVEVALMTFNDALTIGLRNWEIFVEAAER